MAIFGFETKVLYQLAIRSSIILFNLVVGKLRLHQFQVENRVFPITMAVNE